jgi:hypothetical protein
VPEKTSKPRRFHPVRLVSVLGMLWLAFVLGALVMFFGLPMSEFLAKAFTGGRAWFHQMEISSPIEVRPFRPLTIQEDRPDKTFDGYTLYMTYRGSDIFLINMRGHIVHKWSAPFHKVWPEAPQVPTPIHASRIGFFGNHLFANGDLLAVYHGNDDFPYGYGLVKLDKDSKVLWRYSANAHHDVDVGDDGRIYALTQDVIDEVPEGLEFIQPPLLVDYLVVLSPEGQEQKRIPILEAFRDSPYALLLSMAYNAPRHRKQAVPTKVPRSDILHTNFVHVLSQELAPKFPRFKPGQVLISLRELDALAVMDIDSGRVVWAAQGPWRSQHAPQFLGNGRILVFDNLGSAMGSRVLEYDPHTQALPWSYQPAKSRSFTATLAGMGQRLPNGNTLIVNSNDGKLLEVSLDKELVWQCACHRHVWTARRYAPEQLPFIRGDKRVRD